MTNALDGVRYPLGCPQCNHRFKLPIGKLEEACSILCPKCDARLKISNYQCLLIRRKVERLYTKGFLVKKTEKREYMPRRAIELAESGNHRDYISIEIALRGEGFPEVRHYLNDGFLRQELNEICRKARSWEDKNA